MAASAERVPELIAAAARPAFQPPRWFANAHYQTIWANRRKRHPVGARLAAASVRAVILTDDGDQLQLHWSSHEGTHPVLVVLHGLTGCADSENVLGTAAKGYSLGFDVVRVDLRNSQRDDTPSLGVGHAGRSEDLLAVIDHVAEERPGARVAVIGFSLGGNIALKAAGECGRDYPRALCAIATISVPIDLDNACEAIDGRRQNWIYRTYFLRLLRRRYRTLHARHPDRFPALDFDRIRGIRDWDNAVVAPLGGFESAEDYYARSSAVKVAGEVCVPTLIVQAQDDPFIPFDPFQRAAVQENDSLTVLATPRGGHVGFFARAGLDGEPDRYWAENRALAFCAAAVGLDWAAAPLDSLERSWAPTAGAE